MKNFISILLILIGANLNAQSDTKHLTLDDFNGLKVVGQLEVSLQQSDKNSADIKILKGNLDDIKLKVDSVGILRIGFGTKSKSNFANQKAKITLHYNSIRMIKAIENAKINTLSPLETDKLEILCSSGSSIQMDIKVNNLDAIITSGAKIILSGDAHNQTIKATSGSNYDASNLYCNKVNAKSFSGANVSVWVTEGIVGKSNAGGKLVYKGNPKKKDITGPPQSKSKRKQR